MKHAAGVGLCERIGNGRGPPEALTRTEIALAYPFAQGLAFEELEGEIRLPLVLPDGVDRHDVRVVELGGGSRLEQKSLGGIVGLEGAGLDDLERDLATERRVPSQIDLGHAAAVDWTHHQKVIDPASRLKSHGFAI